MKIRWTGIDAERASECGGGWVNESEREMADTSFILGEAWGQKQEQENVGWTSAIATRNYECCIFNLCITVI